MWWFLVQDTLSVVKKTNKIHLCTRALHDKKCQHILVMFERNGLQRLTEISCGKERKKQTKRERKVKKRE